MKFWPEEPGYERRQWGEFFTLFDDVDNHKVKMIRIEPGEKISLQVHQKRSETWFVLQGCPTIFLGSVLYPQPELAIANGFTFTINDSSKRIIEVALGQWHRITNNTDTPVVILEVQKGDCREDDIIRRDDKYGRT